MAEDAPCQKTNSWYMVFYIYFVYYDCNNWQLTIQMTVFNKKIDCFTFACCFVLCSGLDPEKFFIVLIICINLWSVSVWCRLFKWLELVIVICIIITIRAAIRKITQMIEEGESSRTVWGTFFSFHTNHSMTKPRLI